jgi:error-prone DNA polymerase
MGFYAPAQLIQDAKAHGVLVAPVDINASDWECTLEPIDSSGLRPGVDSDEGRKQFSPPAGEGSYSLRLGLQMIRGLSESVGRSVVEARLDSGPFRDIADLAKRAGLGQGAITRLADSGALECITGDRRAALWQSLAQERSSTEHTLFEDAGVDTDEAIPESLTAMQEIEEVYADYETLGLSLRAHPLSFVRTQLDYLRVTSSKLLRVSKDSSYVRVAGIVIVRQRPGTAKGITFVTLEDEFGSMNLVVKPEIWQRHYKVARRSNAWLVHGLIENRENIIHVVVGRIEDLSQHVANLTIRSRDFH